MGLRESVALLETTTSLEHNARAREREREDTYDTVE